MRLKYIIFLVAGAGIEPASRAYGAPRKTIPIPSRDLRYYYNASKNNLSKLPPLILNS